MFVISTNFNLFYFRNILSKPYTITIFKALWFAFIILLYIIVSLYWALINSANMIFLIQNIWFLFCIWTLCSNNTLFCIIDIEFFYIIIVYAFAILTNIFFINNSPYIVTLFNTIKFISRWLILVIFIIRAFIYTIGI